MRMGRSGASLNGGLDIVEGLLERLAVQIVRGNVDLASQVLGKVRGGRLRRFTVRLELGDALMVDADGVGSGTGRHDYLARVGGHAGPRGRLRSDVLSVAARTCDG